MNTHDKYVLPPLPEPLCNLPTYCQDAIRQYTRSVLDDHLNAQDAAIEADRQARDCGQCVPLSTDGTAVFIDGVGDVPLDFSGQARGELIDWEAVAADQAMTIALLESDRQTRGEPFKSRRIDDVMRGLQASVAVGSDGEWVSIRREARDAAINRLQELNSDCAHMYESYVKLASRSAPQHPQIPDGLTDILREAARIIEAIPPGSEPKNMRFPIVDELEGLAAMLEAAPEVSP